MTQKQSDSTHLILAQLNLDSAQLDPFQLHMPTEQADVRLQTESSCLIQQKPVQVCSTDLESESTAGRSSSEGRVDGL